MMCTVLALPCLHIPQFHEVWQAFQLAASARHGVCKRRPVCSLLPLVSNLSHLSPLGWLRRFAMARDLPSVPACLYSKTSSN